MNPPPTTARDAAMDVAHRLIQAGHQALFAGGCVRDRLLHLDPKDYDIATSATPQQILALFPKADQVGAHFGVIIVHHQKHHIEVATFRTDGSYSDSRRPTSVSFSSPEHDAQRRDFTINGLFENPLTGDIIDHVGGLDDLKSHTLRAIGNPSQRFREDALRLLRAVRFSSRLACSIEPSTLQAITEHAHLLQHISPERIRDEFSRILTCPQRRQGLQQLVDTGLMQWIIPEFLDTIGCEQPPEWHPEGDVFIHTMIMLDLLADNAPLELCLAVLLHDIGKPPCRTVDETTGRIRFNGHDSIGANMSRSILSRLRYPNHTIDDVCHMVSRHMQFMHVQHMRVATLKRFMSADRFDLEMELHRVDCASSNGFTDNYDFLQDQAKRFASEPLIPPPLVSGRDLIELGLQPSPRFKKILDAIQTEQLEGRILDREAALAYLKHLLTTTETPP